MTDNEIIKALECCSHRGKGCDDCPVNYKTAEFCFEDVMSDALDLINSQKAEIERYLHSIKMLENDMQTAKSEAIKEFAERLKEILQFTDDSYECWEIEGYINDLVKEMTVVQESEEN